MHAQRDCRLFGLRQGNATPVRVYFPVFTKQACIAWAQGCARQHAHPPLNTNHDSRLVLETLSFVRFRLCSAARLFISFETDFCVLCS